MKVFKIFLFLFFLILSGNILSARERILKNYQVYLKKTYFSVLSIYKNYEKTPLENLILNIIQEAKGKKVDEQEVVDFLKIQEENFAFIKKNMLQNKIKEPSLVKDFFELLRNHFDHEIFEKMTREYFEEKFQEKYSKALYFYIHSYYNPEIKTIFKEKTLSVFALACFYKNLPIEYINTILSLLEEFKDFEEHSIDVFYRFIIEEKKIEEIRTEFFQNQE